MSYSEDDMDAMGAAAAGADYGGSMGSTTSSSSSSLGGSAGDFDGVSFGGGSGAPTGGGDDQGAVAASFNYGFGAPPTQEQAAASFNYGFGSGGSRATSPVNNLSASGIDYTSLDSDFFEDLVMPRDVAASEFARQAGINIAPYNPDMVTFAGGRQFAEIDPAKGPSLMELDVGRAPEPEVDEEEDDRNFLEKAIDAIVGGTKEVVRDQDQRAAMYDPLTGKITGPTYQKTSDNTLKDAVVNVVNPAKLLTGVVNTKDYMPLTGGDTYQYTRSTGGLLSPLIDQSFKSYSEMEEANRNRGGDGDGGQQSVVQQIADVEDPMDQLLPRLPEANLPFMPRQRTYNPFDASFYQMPTRFTQPTGLLV